MCIRFSNLLAKKTTLILKSLCAKFFHDKLNFEILHGLMQYLDKQQHNPDFAKDMLDLLRNEAINFILKNYPQICQEHQTNLEFYENFLIRNIALDTLVLLTSFIYGPENSQNIEKKRTDGSHNEQREIPRQGTRNCKSLGGYFELCLAKFQKTWARENQSAVAKSLLAWFNLAYLWYHYRATTEKKISNSSQMKKGFFSCDILFCIHKLEEK